MILSFLHADIVPMYVCQASVAKDIIRSVTIRMYVSSCVVWFICPQTPETKEKNYVVRHNHHASGNPTHQFTSTPWKKRATENVHAEHGTKLRTEQWNEDPCNTIKRRSVSHIRTKLRVTKWNNDPYRKIAPSSVT